VYGVNETEASKSALLELGLALKRYHGDMVLTGGWAPYFITNRFFSHCGSIDIDFVLKTSILKKYDSIRKTVIDLGYLKENEFRFSKEVASPVDKKDYSIHLDFLCEKEGLRYMNIRTVQDDLAAFAFDGCDIAFDFNYEQEVAAVLPKNGKARTTINVVDLVGSLVLKGQAIDGRSKPKDYYDVYSMTFFNGSPDKAARYLNDRVRTRKLAANREKLMNHSLSVIREKFEDADSMGPYQVQTFTDGEIDRLDAFRRIDAFLKAIDLGP
jgi:hypothetical protein